MVILCTSMTPAHNTTGQLPGVKTIAWRALPNTGRYWHPLAFGANGLQIWWQPGIAFRLIYEGRLTAAAVASGWRAVVGGVEYSTAGDIAFELDPGNNGELRWYLRNTFAPNANYTDDLGNAGHFVLIGCGEWSGVDNPSFSHDYLTDTGPHFETGDAPPPASALSSVEIARYEGDLPMFVAPNATEQTNVPAEWRESGSWTSGADVTDTDTVIEWSTSRTADRWAHLPTRASTTPTTAYLIYDLDDVGFDVVAILGHNLRACGATEVAIEVSSSSDFGTALAIATWTSDFGVRLVSTNLTDGTDDMRRFENVRYLRIRIECDGTVAPEIGELFLGTRFTVPHRADREADDESLDSRYAEAETEGGDRQRLKRWSGRLSTALTWTADTDEYVATFRDFFRATRSGTDPFLWIPHPESAPEQTHYCRTDPVGDVVNEQAAINTRTVPLYEQAPFVSKDLVE